VPHRTIGLLLAAVSAAGAEKPTLTALMKHSGQYVLAFEQDASGIVLEESYEQSLRRGPRVESRRLVSEFVLVTLPGETGVFGFRDVFQVDGRPVRDRDMRLERLFLRPTQEGLDQASAILDASARYNLGSTVRNFNFPTLPLLILRPETQLRFAFRDRGPTRVAGRPARKIDFEESRTPTLIRDPSRNEDVLSRGNLVLEEETGALLRSELRIADARGRSQIAVDYGWVEALGLWLPTEMAETYDGPGGAFAPIGTTIRVGGAESLTASARYTRPRRFGVTTEERMGSPP
jgi:hypothetical protein